VVQNVEVPLVARTCPERPKLLLKSLNSPVRRNLAIVEDASAAFDAKRSVDDELVVNAFVVVLLVIVALVDPRLVEVALVSDVLPDTVRAVAEAVVSVV
jgi:hypothetical protein